MNKSLTGLELHEGQ